MRITCSFLCLLFIACNNQPLKNADYHIPDKGYPFVTPINPKDSSFPFYPVRTILSNSDSTDYAFFAKKLFDSFHEPNISLRPGETPVFRFVYSQWTDFATIVTITPSAIIAKTGDRVDYLHYVESNLRET